MKKVITLFAVATVLLVGCGKTDATEKYKDIMKGFGESYYNEYAKPYLTAGDADKFTVSIENLRTANTTSGADFDLGGLSKCSSASSVTLILDQAGNVADYEYYFECQ